MGLMTKRMMSMVGDRLGWVLLAIVAGLFLWTDHNEAMMKARLASVNRLRPDYQILVEAKQSNWQFEPTDRRQFILYAQQVAMVLKDRVDTKGLLAFFYGISGDHQRAMETYQSALASHPALFWHHYNLGLLNLQAGDYDRCEASLSAALQSSVALTLKYVLSSRYIYLPMHQVFVQDRDIGSYFQTDIKQGLKKAQYLRDLIRQGQFAKLKQLQQHQDFQLAFY